MEAPGSDAFTLVGRSKVVLTAHSNTTGREVKIEVIDPSPEIVTLAGQMLVVYRVEFETVDQFMALAPERRPVRIGSSPGPYRGAAVHTPTGDFTVMNSSTRVRIPQLPGSSIELLP
jgi:hypothetical protein